MRGFERLEPAVVASLDVVRDGIVGRLFLIVYLRSRLVIAGVVEVGALVILCRLSSS